jgi:hypothetical protein
MPSLSHMLRTFLEKAFFLTFTFWVIRLALMFTTVQDPSFFSVQESEFLSIVVLLLWNSFRFDLLVSCFLLTPLWALWTPVFSRILSKRISLITNIYFCTFFGLSTLYSLFSFTYLLKYKHHFRKLVELKQFNDFIFSSSQILFASTALILLVLSFYLFWKLKKNLSEQFRPPRWKTWLLTGILLALGARGTVSHHHLRREDCQVTNSAYLTEVCLNALWAADKPVFN